MAGLTNRRGLLGIAASLPVVGGSLALLGLEDAGAKQRRKRNHDSRKHDNRNKNDQRRDHDVASEKKKKKHKKKKKGNVQCTPQDQSVTCSGKCGSVTNNCNQAVNCGTCVCNPPCPAGRICASGNTCVPCATAFCNDVCCSQSSAICNQSTGECCLPETEAQTCASQCGSVTNNCGQPVNCSPCVCPATCPGCEFCDGTTGGECIPKEMGMPCGEKTCSNGQVTSAGGCNGSGGECQGQFVTDCAISTGYAKCNGAGNDCATSCDGDGDCGGKFRCDNHACVPKSGQGKPCSDGVECATGFCVGGFCCDSACNDACKSCNVDTKPGTCLPVANGTLCGSGNVCCEGACQTCCDAEDCTTGAPVCASGTCQVCTANPEGCPDGTCCDPDSGQCVLSCPSGKPICYESNNTCNVACASHAACGDTSQFICVNDQCRSCDVHDGENLSQAIANTPQGRTLFVCPGTYTDEFNSFGISRAITIIGAGKGDASGVVTKLIGTVTNGTSEEVTLRGLRISATGNAQGVVNGVYPNTFANLTMVGCAVVGNLYGGVFNLYGSIEMRDCLISENTGGFNNTGGGILNMGGPVTLRNCTVQNNLAGSGAGYAGTDLDVGHSISLDLYDTNVSYNTGGGVYVGPGATVTTHGTSAICGNNGDQCAGFSDPACQTSCPA